jgi:hypothetical protein
MKRATQLLILVVLLAGTFVLTSYAQGTKVPTSAPTDSTSTTDVALLFAPLVAAATGIERTLEMSWSWIESLFVQVIAFVGMGYEWTRWAREEITRANSAVSTIAGELARLHAEKSHAPEGPDTPQETRLLQAMRDAEGKLLFAQTRMESVVKNERYRRIKQALSVVAGVAMGVVIAVSANLKMFALLGVGHVPADVDLVLTGLIIGTGSAPVHSLIGILQMGKDTLADTSQLLKGRYELAVNEARSPDLAAMRSTDGKLSGDYQVYLNKRPNS